MERLNVFIVKSWRAVMTAVLLLLVFAVPASKGVLSKLFSVHATGGNNQGNNQANSNHNSHSENSASQSSHGSPHSSPTASPTA